MKVTGTIKVRILVEIKEVSPDGQVTLVLDGTQAPPLLPGDLIEFDGAIDYAEDGSL